MLPHGEDPQASPALAFRVEPAQGLHMPATVLVIDDEASLRETLRDALTTDSTSPVHARGAPDALHELDRGVNPDAILIDVDMEDGLLALARVYCATDYLVPVVALSSSPRRLLEAGIADAVLMKPYEVDSLRACVTQACGAHRGAF